MLRNNNEREIYFRDESNWASIKLYFIANDSGKIQIRKLIGYPIIKIQAVVNINEPTVCTLGCYEIDGQNLKDVYNKTMNQCIAIMREADHV